MPTALRVRHDLRAFHSEYFGDISVEDVLDQRKQIQAQPEFDTSYSLIVDLTGVTGMAMRYDQVQIIAKSPTPLGPHSKLIFVAPSDLAYGIVRMYQALGEEQHPYTAIVRCLDHALSLLSE